MGTLTQTIKILLVDDHVMFREGLAQMLVKDPEFEVVGQTGSAAEALSILIKSDAGLVLLDVDLGGDRALDFVIEARKLGFDGKVLVVTAGLSGAEAVQLVQSGVAGILHKHHSSESLCNAMHEVVRGGACIENDYLRSLFRSVDKSRGPRANLTEREKQMVRFIFQGLTNKEIGGHLGVSEGAVKASLHVLFEKAGARTRAQLVKIAIERYRDQI